jgi:hypothetical protein
LVISYLIKRVLEGKIEGRGRRGRRRKELLDDLKDTKPYWKWKQKVLNLSLLKTRFGRGYGYLARHDNYCTNGKLDRGHSVVFKVH